MIHYRRITSHHQLLLHHPNKAGYPAKPHHALIAGAVGGYFVWGNYTPIHNQILLYISSRVVMGLFKLWTTKETSDSDVLKDIQVFTTNNRFQWYPYVSAIVWGTVMYLFEEVPHVLQPSLKASMEEIYRFLF